MGSDSSPTRVRRPDGAGVVELDDVGLSLGSRGAGDQGPSGGRLGRSGRLFGVELDDPPPPDPLVVYFCTNLVGTLSTPPVRSSRFSCRRVLNVKLQAQLRDEYGADLRCIAEHHLEDAEAFGSDAIASGIYLRPNGVALPVLMLPDGQAAEVLGGARPFDEAADAVRAAREGEEVYVRLARRRSLTTERNAAWVEQEEAVLDSAL